MPSSRTGRTEFEIDVTATDPHGASVSTYFTVRLPAIPDNNGAPRFKAQAESPEFHQGRGDRACRGCPRPPAATWGRTT